MLVPTHVDRSSFINTERDGLSVDDHSSGLGLSLERNLPRFISQIPNEHNGRVVVESDLTWDLVKSKLLETSHVMNYKSVNANFCSTHLVERNCGVELEFELSQFPWICNWDQIIEWGLSGSFHKGIGSSGSIELWSPTPSNPTRSKFRSRPSRSKGRPWDWWLTERIPVYSKKMISISYSTLGTLC